MDRIREVSFKAARRAGAILRERLGNIKNVDYKSAFNLVTDVDHASEHEIISILRQEFPDHRILGEESGLHHSDSGCCWMVDPLDGTTNYTHSYPFFCISIGFEEAGKVRFGAVYNPIADEMFHAEAGKGAFLNDAPIHVSSNASISVSLLATGFPNDTGGARFTNMKPFSRVTDLSHGVRRDASAALDLCFVACGRLDGFWELVLGPWDFAAGTLIVAEARGRVTNLAGGPVDLFSGHVIATNGLIHDELVKTLDLARFETTGTLARAGAVEKE
jgi:myo-inositol-1(or 4)-monophosphatase